MAINKFQMRRNQGGFSLLEVLVAIVILSVGLLALASLQINLIRASSDVKAQSNALSLAKDKLEELRDFQTLAAYRALTDRAAPTCPGSDVECISVGAVNYTRSWTVSRFAYNGTSSFVALGDTAAVPAGYGTNNEFKRVVVRVGWTDPTGAARSLQVEDALSALDPADSARLAKEAKTIVARKPKVIIVNPAGTEGVIPIAIGNGSDTAATNPTPEVVGRGSTGQHVVETRYDILTYAALAGDNTKATAQNRVETVIAGCACDLATTTTYGYRPTYWDGQRYVDPAPSTTLAPAVAATNLTTTQSSMCTICCRDHHDPSGVVGPKFSPRRSTHTHYNPGTIAVATSGTSTTFSGGDPVSTTTPRYQEACRIIRVDGIFRVAADTYADHVDLLQTNSDASSNLQAAYTLPPATAAATITSTYRYAGLGGYVLTYMANRFVTPTPSGNAVTDQTAYNTASAGGSPASALHPASITMSKAESFVRWLHLRGLYVDYLEPAAVAKINEAKAACLSPPRVTACTATEKATAILKLLPFTSINLTEIAQYTPFRQTQNPANSLNNSTTFDVPYYEDVKYDHLFSANNDFIGAIDSVAPIRGATETGAALPGNKPNNTPYTVSPKVSAEILYSNEGLALLQDPINTDAPMKQDIQTYFMNAGNPLASAGNFSVTIPKVTNPNPNAYTFSTSTAAYPKFSAPAPGVRCNASTKGGSKPNPFNCISKGLNAVLPLTVTSYNISTTTTTASSSALTCTAADGSGTTVTRSGSYTQTVCKNYSLASATSSPARTMTITAPASGTDGRIAESTLVTVSPLAQTGDAYTLNLQPQGTDTPVASTCTFITGANGNPIYTIVPGVCP